LAPSQLWGGDISSLSQNPQEIGVFRASELTVSPQLFRLKQRQVSMECTSSNLSDFNLSQIGIVANLISKQQ